jgi:hypothetical protein
MKPVSIDEELESLKIILHALEPLDEAQRRFVLKTVAERMGVAMTSSSGSGQERAAGTAAGEPIVSPGAACGAAGNGNVSADQTPKQFLRLKMPKTDVQRIACLAYYLTQAREQTHFKTEDLTKLNTEAGGTPFSNPSMAVGNATSLSKFLASVGGGRKQITALGEDIVVALPDQEGAKAVLDRHRKPRKKRAKKAGVKSK